MSSNISKPTKWHVRPAKTQIRLVIRPVWSEYSLSAWRKLGSLVTHWAHSEDPDQTRRMPRLIWVFVGRTVILFVLSCCGLILNILVINVNVISREKRNYSNFHNSWSSIFAIAFFGLPGLSMITSDWWNKMHHQLITSSMYNQIIEYHGIFWRQLPIMWHRVTQCSYWF